jgi:hypothetical protein
VTGSGTATPAPVLTVNPALLPCLALFNATLSATSPVAPGQHVTVAVDSVPNKPLFVVANAGVAHVPLGPWGWTQVDPFTGLVLGDALGLLGSAIPAMTNANGHWEISAFAPIAPPLTGVTAIVDAYVLDPAAANGAFHQPPFATIVFN